MLRRPFSDETADGVSSQGTGFCVRFRAGIDRSLTSVLMLAQQRWRHRCGLQGIGRDPSPFNASTHNELAQRGISGVCFRYVLPRQRARELSPCTHARNAARQLCNAAQTLSHSHRATTSVCSTRQVLPERCARFAQPGGSDRRYAPCRSGTPRRRAHGQTRLPH